MKRHFYSWLLVLVVCASAHAGAPQFSEPVVPADPDAAGKELAARLRSMRPSESVTNSATLQNFVRKKLVGEMPMKIVVNVGATNWSTTYSAKTQDGSANWRLVVIRNQDGSTKYQLQTDQGGSIVQSVLSGAGLVVPFADSEFLIADLGMEYLQWSTQRLLKKEICRSQSCDKLESIAPPGWTNGYVRVISWFDIDTGGPVLVEAYDAKGKMIKEFKPNDFKKVDGQWQVEEIEITSPRTGARSTIHFNLDGK